MERRAQVIEVWGELACFSRPDIGKVERFSYPVMTPSAARGIFDAIYCKPSWNGSDAEFRWQVQRVEVLAPIAYIALRRNEVKDKANAEAVTSWMNGAEHPEPLWADGDKNSLGSDQKGRTQRQTMALKDVHYRLYAEVRPWPGHEGKLRAFDEQFKRRATQGKCFFQPYFGCREFPAYFEQVDQSANRKRPIEHDQDLGLMLYDVFDLSKPGRARDDPSISLFRARLERGVMEVPAYESDTVLKGAAGGH